MRALAISVAVLLATNTALFSQDTPQTRSLFDTPDDLNLKKPTPALSRPVSINPAPISAARIRHIVPKEAEKEFKKAIAEQKKWHLDLSLQHFQEAVKLDPDYWDAYAHLADIYWRRNQPGEALSSLDAAVKIDPNSDDLQVNRAVALLALGRPGEAESAARRAIELKPSLEEAHYLVAVAQVRQGHITSETATHLSTAAVKLPQAGELKTKVEELLVKQAPRLNTQLPKP